MRPNPPNLSGPLVRLGGMGLVSGVVAGLGAALNVSDERASHCEGPLMDEHRQGFGMQPPMAIQLGLQSIVASLSIPE